MPYAPCLQRNLLAGALCQVGGTGFLVMQKLLKQKMPTPSESAAEVAVNMCAKFNQEEPAKRPERIRQLLARLGSPYCRILGGV